jgi:hypothetical protein
MPILVEGASKMKAQKENTSLRQQQRMAQTMQLHNETNAMI